MQPMNNPRSGRRVLNFAVSGVLLGGGVSAGLVGGCAAKDKPVTNTGQVQEPDADAKHMNMAHEAEPEPDRVNVGPEGEPADVKHVNTAHEDDPEAKHVNVAKESEPEPEQPAKVNPGPTPSE